jgi:hypothetical protein
MKEISLLKLKPTKQLWNLNPSMKELFYTLEFQRRNSTCRFSIGYHGDEGEDVTALIAEKIQNLSQNLNLKMKKLQLHLKLKRRKSSTTSLPEGSRYCHHASTERHNDRRNSSHLVKQSR